jgi:predicted RNase H-like HicB family nuclease
MLTSYIRTAMHRATYERLQNNQYYAEIPGLDGVFATAPTLEGCRDELQSVLEGWIILGFRLGHEIPAIDGCSLEVTLEAA